MFTESNGRHKRQYDRSRNAEESESSDFASTQFTDVICEKVRQHVEEMRQTLVELATTYHASPMEIQTYKFDLLKRYRDPKFAGRGDQGAVW